MKRLAKDFYPPHMEVGNFFYHNWKGQKQIGRHLVCNVCDLMNNTRNRNGDAKFVRAHRRCMIYR